MAVRSIQALFTASKANLISYVISKSVVANIVKYLLSLPRQTPFLGLPQLICPLFSKLKTISGCSVFDVQVRNIAISTGLGVGSIDDFSPLEMMVKTLAYSATDRCHQQSQLTRKHPFSRTATAIISLVSQSSRPSPAKMYLMYESGALPCSLASELISSTTSFRQRWWSRSCPIQPPPKVISNRISEHHGSQAHSHVTVSWAPAIQHPYSRQQQTPESCPRGCEFMQFHL